MRQGKGVESLECAFLIVREFTYLHNNLSCKSVGRSAILVRRLQGLQVLSQSFDSRFQETVVSELIFRSREFGNSSVLQEVRNLFVNSDKLHGCVMSFVSHLFGV